MSSSYSHFFCQTCKIAKRHKKNVIQIQKRPMKLISLHDTDNLKSISLQLIWNKIFIRPIIKFIAFVWTAVITSSTIRIIGSSAKTSDWIICDVLLKFHCVFKYVMIRYFGENLLSVMISFFVNFNYQLTKVSLLHCHRR